MKTLLFSLSECFHWRKKTPSDANGVMALTRLFSKLEPSPLLGHHRHRLPQQWEWFVRLEMPQKSKNTDRSMLTFSIFKRFGRKNDGSSLHSGAGLSQKTNEKHPINCAKGSWTKY